MHGLLEAINMTRMGREEVKIHIIENVMPLLEKAVNSFHASISKPRLIGDEKDGFQPRFLEPNSGHFMLLMSVKIVSTLNATVCLLKGGYVQEVGVLLRVVDECVAKVLCIEEAHTKGVLNSEQKKIVDDYFKNDIRNIEDLIAGSSWWVDMKKINASGARYLSEGTPNKDVHTIQKHIQTIYDTLTGYVHGFYSHIMELYDSNDELFRLKGLTGTSRVNGTLPMVSSAVLRTLNTFSQIALRFNLVELRKELIQNRDIFMTSEAYTSE